MYEDDEYVSDEEDEDEYEYDWRILVQGTTVVIVYLLLCWSTTVPVDAAVHNFDTLYNCVQRSSWEPTLSAHVHPLYQYINHLSYFHGHNYT